MYLNQQKVLYKKATSMIQDPTVIITNIWSMLLLTQTYLNQQKVLLKKTTVYRGAMAHAGHPLESPLGIAPASLTFHLPI